jgi:CRISPR-associated protein Cas4
MLREIIDDYYSNRQKDRNQVHFYITDAGKCPRQVWFSLKGYPKKPLEPHVLRQLHHGDVIHSKLMTILYSLGLVKATEIEIPPQEFINGRADAIICIDNRDYVVEIKSINNFAFEKLDYPNPDHVKQINMYMHYFKIPKGILIYENKNTQELREFGLDYDEALANNVLEFLSGIRQHLDMNQVPVKPANLEQWRCDYCPYAEECGKL